MAFVIKVWKMQGLCGTTPLKTKRKAKISFKRVWRVRCTGCQGWRIASSVWKSRGEATSDHVNLSSHHVRPRGRPRPALRSVTCQMHRVSRLKKSPHSWISAVALVIATSKSAKTTIVKPEDDRYTLDRWKLYLDICATYHYFFTKEFLLYTKKGDTTLTCSCNAGTTVINTRGWWREFQVWLNKHGIANLLSIPMLEAAVYIVSSHTKKDWVVFAPKGKKIVFKRDTGITKGMP